MGDDNICLIGIHFEEQWMKKLLSEGVRIVRTVEKWITSEELGKLQRGNSTSLEFAIQRSSLNDFAGSFSKKWNELFNGEAMDGKVWFTGDLAGIDLPVQQPEPPQKPKEAPPKTDSPAEPQPAATATEEEAASPNAVVEKICSSVPIKYDSEFIDYFRKTKEVIPMLQKMGTMSAFWHQSLLVSIDAGWGLTSFLKCLAKMFTSFNLLRTNPKNGGFQEIVIGKPDNEHEKYDGWKTAVAAAEEMHQRNEGPRDQRPCTILSLDISEWHSNLNEPAIKAFLREINDLTTNFLCVFRVPFLESHVLQGVAESLSDILNVDVLVAPPNGIDDMVDYVREKLARKGFELDSDGIARLEQWILKEKSDDSFFGYKSLDKIVQRTIYEKAVNNCKTGNVSKLIGKDDLIPFVNIVESVNDPEDELKSLIGMGNVKQKLNELIVQIHTQKTIKARGRGKRLVRPTMHMLFTGNPGTGKTTVARIAAQIMKKHGILRKGHLVEVRGRDLCGRYVGETAPKTSAFCRDAYGSVLFIDEAYSLFRSEEDSSRDFGREALDTLVAEMENHREDFCVIFAGYRDEMHNMLKGNIGMRSRIPYELDFPNYSREELEEIFFSMVSDDFEYDRNFRNAVHEFFQSIPDDALNMREFSNARLVRNLYERVWGKAAYRRSMSGEATFKLLDSDLASARQEDEFRQLLEKTNNRKSIGF